MAKEATNPKPSMQSEWYCLAVHKYTRECIFEYAGAEKQTTEKVGFRHCDIFRAHEMRSQLEVTEMLECKLNLTV